MSMDEMDMQSIDEGLFSSLVIKGVVRPVASVDNNEPMRKKKKKKSNKKPLVMPIGKKKTQAKKKNSNVSRGPAVSPDSYDENDSEPSSVENLSQSVNKLSVSRFVPVDEPPTISMEEDEEEEVMIQSRDMSVSSSTHIERAPDVKMPRQFRSPVSETLLNDDEQFTLDDNHVRRILYAASQDVDGKRYKEVKRVVAINFTSEHFEPGATKWFHLKEHSFSLLSSVFNSLAYATGKKVKITPPEKATREPAKKKKQAKKKFSQEEIPLDESVTKKMEESVEKTPEIEINNFLQANKDITCFVETLVKENQVAGYRLWIFDASSYKNKNDALSLGLRESLLEAARIQDQANKQTTALLKAAGTSKSVKAKKAAAQKIYELSKEYSFAHYGTFDRHFLCLAKDYFGRDSAISISEDQNASNNHRHFKDSRAYTKYDVLQQDGPVADYTPEDHPCNFSRLFAKEAAMFYYVLKEGVNESQCRLDAYFPGASGAGLMSRSEESAHCRLDLETGLPKEASLCDIASFEQATQTTPFNQFPYPDITYYLDNTFLSHECISRMPLPHRLGTTLYTQKQLLELKKRASGQQVVSEEDEEMEGDGEDFHPYSVNGSQEVQYAKTLRYCGLHQTELEIGSEIMLTQLHHLDSTGQSCLKLATIPKEVLEKFNANKRNEIYSRLKLILSNLGHRTRMVVTEAGLHTIEEPKRKQQAAANREQTTNVMDQINHMTLLNDWHDLLCLPYISFTLPGVLKNENKKPQILRKANEYLRRKAKWFQNGDMSQMDHATRMEQLEYEGREYESKLMAAHLGHFREILEKYRPFGNSIYTIKSQLQNAKLEETFLERDVFLRLAELNREAYRNLDRKYFDPGTGKVPRQIEEEYMKERGLLQHAMIIECWNEFFKSPNVSLACEGVRADLLKQRVSYTPPLPGATAVGADSILNKKTIGMPLPVHEYNHELRPYAEYRVWVNAMFSDQGGITYNYKTVSILYFSKFHHCRWYPDCNNPKLNVLLSGTGMAGKSHMLQLIKQTLPTSVGDMVTHITDQAFNVSRNLNDMLLIYEEFQNKFLGYAPGNGKNNASSGGGNSSGGVSAGSDKDTTNFLKARMTSGQTTTMSWFENEETGLRDMKISKAHCQGNIFGASNNDFTEADANVMSRFILLSVAKSKNQIEGHRPQDRNKYTYGLDVQHNGVIFEQHREIHRVYYLMEQLVKSNCFGDDAFGVNVDGGRILTNLILDQLQKRYGLQTGDTRKRTFVEELERCMTMSYAVWMGLTSALTRHLQYDPHDPERFVGFNPRVIIEGILPYMVVTKDQVFDAITALSSLWYHEYQDLILEVFATRLCKLQELRSEDFLVRYKHDGPIFNQGGKRGKNSMNGGGGGFGGVADEPEVDYNYIKLSGKKYEAIHDLLSTSLGEMVVAPNDIRKLFHDLSKCKIENCEGYKLVEVATDFNEKGEAVSYAKRLVRDPDQRHTDRPLVEFLSCQETGKPMIAVLVQFLKQKLPAFLPDDVVENLHKDDSAPFTLQDMQQIDPDGEEEEEEEKGKMDVENSAFEREVRKIGKISDRTESLIIKAIKDVMENLQLEDIGADNEKMLALKRSYMNPETRQVPWYSYITADSPKSVKITDFHPELKSELERLHQPDLPVLFTDELLMLDLTPRPSGNTIIIQNHNTISESTRASLSIYKSARKRAREEDEEMLGERDVLRKCRILNYSKTEAWKLDRDIDYIFCGEHLRNIAYDGLKSKSEYKLINYPPCTYMALMEDRQKETSEPLLEYPYVNNCLRIKQYEKKALGLIDPKQVEYNNFSEFMESNFDSGEGAALRASNGDALLIGKPVPNRSLKQECAERRAYIAKLMSEK